MMNMTYDIYVCLSDNLNIAGAGDDPLVLVVRARLVTLSVFLPMVIRKAPRAGHVGLSDFLENSNRESRL